ncbi:MAG TPA: hypothetical protein PLH94_08155 [Fimbriimonadaceae bacterium]|nr:hypothetical protein [Fimbriimonadaceae bacterium]
MSAPGYAPPRNSGNKVLIVILVIIAVMCIGLIAAGVGMYFWSMNLVKNTFIPTAQCAVGFEELRAALLDYAKDHDGKLPKAETWQDDVKPYYAKVKLGTEQSQDVPKGFEIKKFPLDGDWGCKVSDKEMTGIAFNQELSEKKLSDIKDPYSTVILFEIEEPSKNAHEVYVPRSRTNAPRIIMGERRDWFRITVEGRMDWSFDSKGRPSSLPSGPTTGGSEGGMETSGEPEKSPGSETSGQ